jgi:hypothetical protein
MSPFLVQETRPDARVRSILMLIFFGLTFGFGFVTFAFQIISYAIGRLFIYALSFGFVECEAFSSNLDIGYFGKKKPGSQIYVLPAWAPTVVGLIIIVTFIGIIAYSGD